MSRLLPLLAAASLLPSLASAQTLLSGDHSIAGKLCVGYACTSPETFDADVAQKLKATLLGLGFEDTSGTDFPDRDWRLRVNDGGSLASGGIERFSIEDIDAGTIPFTIEGDAPGHAFWVAPSGNIGFGTMLPQTELHIVDGDQAVIRLEQDTSNGDTGQSWDLIGDERGFRIDDVEEGNRYIFRIKKGARPYSLYVDETSYVGLGTSSPDAPLHLEGADSFNFFRITALGAAVNESVDIVFTEGPLGTGQLRYNIVDGDNQEMSLDADGNMILDGTLTTGGPTCAGGCDAVFTEGQIIPERDYSAQMWAQGHLPHVGPTAPGQAFNMTEKMGGMLNALEHAHIYIERQREEIARMKAEKAAQDARIAALEAEHIRALAALTARLDAMDRN